MSPSFTVYFFFFSSRRRHTRLQGDWSSDVCSSDLRTPCSCPDRRNRYSRLQRLRFSTNRRPTCRSSRSEERRVGKECRARRSPHRKKKKDTNDKGMGGK